MSVPLVRLNNGRQCPQIGLGTWLSKGADISQAISTAISIGYRHFDCAFVYGNETMIGSGITECLNRGIVKRDELYVVTKLWNTFHESAQVLPACQTSLSNLQLDYLDLYLMHWPVAQKYDSPTGFNFANPFEGALPSDCDYLDTWAAMEELVRLRKCHSIGVSNFNRVQLQRLLDNCTIKPVMNQIEVTPFLNQRPLIEFCHKNDVQVTAYSPLGSPSRTWYRPGDPIVPFNDEKLLRIASKYGKTVPQIILRYIAQLGTIPIPKSVNPERIKENFEIFDFTLDPDDCRTIDTFNCGARVVCGDELKGFPNYPF